MSKIKNLAKEYWDTIYQNGGIIDSKPCKKCRNWVQQDLKEHISRPSPIQYIGDNYFDEKSERLLFVGIESYSGNELKINESPEYDYFTDEYIEKMYFGEVKKNSQFWRWVRHITDKVIKKGNDSFKYIAWSNLLKCQARKYDLNSDKFEMYYPLCDNCIKNAGWVYKEINEIKPKNVIIFSGRGYDYYLAELFLNDIDGELIRKFDYSKYDLSEKTKNIRKDRDLFIHLKNGDQRIILTNHPRGSPKLIRDEIVRIINKNDWSTAIEWNPPQH